jgi:S-DNA-T family DNA segregation ATPase FtsK/SpoIIIE
VAESNLEATISLGFKAAAYLWREYTHTKPVALVKDTMDVLYPEGKPRPKHIATYRTDFGHTIKYCLTPGCTFESLLQHQGALNDAARCFVDVEKDAGGYVLINIYQGKMEPYYKYELPDPPAGMELPIPIGYSAQGIVWYDLASAPHMLIAGEAGKGKSNFLHGLIRSLLPIAAVCVLDMKRLEYAYLGDHIRLAETEDNGLKLLTDLSTEMDRRIPILKQAGCVNIQEYHSLGGKMDYIVMVIDEFAELRDQRILGLIDHLVRLARAVGISIVAATQRPGSDVISGSTKALMDARLCFRVADGINSRMVLGEHCSAAAYLPDIKGRSIFRGGNRDQVVQTMHLPISQARQILPGEVIRCEFEPADRLIPVS